MVLKGLKEEINEQYYLRANQPEDMHSAKLKIFFFTMTPPSITQRAIVTI